MVAYYDTITGKMYNLDIGGVIPNITDDFVEIDATAYYDLLSQTYTDSSKNITFDTETGLTLSNTPPEPPEEPVFSDENEIIANFYANVTDILLNQTAISYGYNSIDNAISYYNSGITAWREESVAFNAWRDNTLSLMYQNIYGFTADGITLPDLSGFTSQSSYFEVNITTPSRPIF